MSVRQLSDNIQHFQDLFIKLLSTVQVKLLTMIHILYLEVEAIVVLHPDPPSKLVSLLLELLFLGEDEPPLRLQQESLEEANGPISPPLVLLELVAVPEIRRELVYNCLQCTGGMSGNGKIYRYNKKSGKRTCMKNCNGLEKMDMMVFGVTKPLK